MKLVTTYASLDLLGPAFTFKTNFVATGDIVNGELRGDLVIRGGGDPQLTYDRMWKTAIKAGADIVTITSYNEWHEGTQIEPARVALDRPDYDGAWGKTGINAQRAYLTATAHWTARLAARRPRP